MAFVYLKIRNKEKAKKLLNDTLKRYGKEVEGYDLEEITQEIRLDPAIILEYRSLSKKGGSLSLTIPNSVKKYMDLGEGDYLLFTVRKKVGKVLLDKVKQRFERVQP